LHAVWPEGVTDDVAASYSRSPRGVCSTLGPMRPDAHKVSRIFASWNQLDGWLRQVERLRLVA